MFICIIIQVVEFYTQSWLLALVCCGILLCLLVQTPHLFLTLSSLTFFLCFSFFFFILFLAKLINLHEVSRIYIHRLCTVSVYVQASGVTRAHRLLDFLTNLSTCLSSHDRFRLNDPEETELVQQLGKTEYMNHIIGIQCNTLLTKSPSFMDRESNG